MPYFDHWRFLNGEGTCMKHQEAAQMFFAGSIQGSEIESLDAQ